MSPCEIWQGPVDHRGWPREYRQGRYLRVVALRAHLPSFTPFTLLCGNKRCVNPKHVCVRGQNRRKVTRHDRELIRASSERPAELARRYGVLPSYISKLRNDQLRDYPDEF